MLNRCERLQQRSGPGAYSTWRKSFGWHPTSQDTRYRPAGRAGGSDDIERLDWVSRCLDLTEPEAEVLFDLGGPTYTPSDITREHLLAILEAIREGEPVDRNIWVRSDPGRVRKST